VPAFPQPSHPQEGIVLLLLELLAGNHIARKVNVARTPQVLFEGLHDYLLHYANVEGLRFRFEDKINPPRPQVFDAADGRPG
jgi:hypothetical protein